MSSLRTRLGLEPLDPRLNPSSNGYNVFGAAPGGAPLVEVDRPDGTVLARFTALDPAYKGGVRTAAGELDGNPFTVEVAAGYGADGPPRVVIYSVDEQTGKVSKLTTFDAYEAGFRGGVRVAVGDIMNSQSVDQIVVGADTQGGSRVRTFWLSGNQVVQTDGEFGNFFAFEPSFRGGVRVAAGDLDGDTTNGDELVIAAGPGGGPRVLALHADGSQAASFFAFPQNYGGGVNVGFRSVGGDAGVFYATKTGDDPSQANAVLNRAAGVGVVAAAGPINVVTTPTGAVQTVITSPSTGLAVGATGIVIATNGVVFGDADLVNRLGLNTTAFIPSNTNTNSALALASVMNSSTSSSLSAQSLNLVVANGGSSSGQGVIVGSNSTSNSGGLTVVPSSAGTDSSVSLSQSILNQAVSSALSSGA